MSSVVAARVKEMLAGMNMRTGGDFVDALDKEVEALVKRAAKRTKDNGRQTVYGYDL